MYTREIKKKISKYSGFKGTYQQTVYQVTGGNNEGCCLIKMCISYSWSQNRYSTEVLQKLLM